MSSLRLTFLGATGTVTGSCFLVEVGKTRVLVDCGLYQGPKELRLRNWERFPVEPSSIDAVVVTHAHLDHSGLLPKLVREGFRGTIHSTPATRDLCEILLADSAKLQEEEARFANLRGYSKHKPARPLYGIEDVEKAKRQFTVTTFGAEFPIASGISARFTRAGHILGAASVTLRTEGVSVFFSGDVGRPGDAVLRAPDPPVDADYLLVESTYGDRAHDPADPEALLSAIIAKITGRGGTLVVPAFSVGRTQSLLYHLSRLKDSGRLADIPVFLDSPMSIDATGLLCRYLGEHRLTEEDCKKLCKVAKYLRTAEQSKAAMRTPGPKIILSASGMATGGRVLHHLEAFLPDAKNAVLLTGFQAAGTRGASLLSGAKRVKIHGMEVPVNAEIVSLQSLSAHADRPELLSWLRKCPRLPKRLYLVHGEPIASHALKKAVEEELHWSCALPEFGRAEELT